MASVNKVILIGNIGQDPDLRYTPAGKAATTLSVATSRRWKSKETGESQEETEWHRVVLYDRLAEIAGEYLKKGRPVYIEGRLKTRKWQDKDGRDNYTTEIVAEDLKLLGSREDSDEGGRRAPAPNTRQAQRAQAPAPAERRAPPPKSSTGFDDMDDDIPF